MDRHVPPSTGLKSFGKMAVRTILFLTAKQKMSRETTTYEDLAAILVQFTKDVQQGAIATEPVKEEDIKVTNVIDASPQAIAFLQAEHMKLNGLHLCWIDIFLFGWNHGHLIGWDRQDHCLFGKPYF